MPKRSEYAKRTETEYSMIYRKSGESMYIPDFWCGYVLGAMSTLVALIIIGLAFGRKKKR